MTKIYYMAERDGTTFYPMTHAEAVLGLNEFVTGLIKTLVKPTDPTDLSKYWTIDETKQAISDAVKGLIPSTNDYINAEQANDLIKKAIDAYKPNLTDYSTTDEIAQQISKAIDTYSSSHNIDLSKYPTFEQMKTEIQDEIKGLNPATPVITKNDVQTMIDSAIANAKPDLSSYVTSEAMTSAINDAIAKAKPDLSSYVTSETMTNAINDAIAKAKPSPTDLSNYWTIDETKQAISDAVKGLAPSTQDYINAEQANGLIKKALDAYKPDLTSYSTTDEVAQQISKAIDSYSSSHNIDLSNYPTFEQMKTEIQNEIKGLNPASPVITKDDVQTMIDNAIAKAKPDLSSYVTESELKEVASKIPDVSSLATKNDVSSMISSANTILLNSNFFSSKVQNIMLTNEPTDLTMTLSINGGVFTDKLYATTKGGFVSLTWAGMDVNSNYTTFGTLPNWACPWHQITCPVFCMDQNYHTYSVGTLQINTDGSMTLQSPIGYGYAQFTVTYRSINS